MSANWYIRALCDDAAKRLTGREVDIRWEQPYSQRLGRAVNGIAQKSGGRGIITLEPDRPLLDIYKTFLHEAGHLAVDWDRFEDSGQPGGVTEKVTYAVNQLHTSMEDRAENQAHEWDAWATSRQKTSVGEKLLELAACYPGDG